MSDAMEHVPEGVRARIERGEVPPPRDWTDPSDPIRDVRYAIAVAEDQGDMDAVLRYNIQWTNLIRDGHDKDTWTPPVGKRLQQTDGNAPTRSSLVEAARKAEEAGDHETANALKLQAQRANHDVDPATVMAARMLDDKLATAHELSFQEREALIAEQMQVNARMLQQMRGEPEPEPPPPPPEPLTVEELGDARREVEAELRQKMDAPYVERRELNRRLEHINAELLARARQRQEPSFAMSTTNPGARPD